MTINATYHIRQPESKIDAVAEKLAIGLTVGSWTDLTAEDRDHLERFKGQVIEKKVLEENLLEVVIGYPESNVTPDFSSIITTVFGKLSLDGEVKLIDLEFAADYYRHFKGPAFGIEGIRELLGVAGRPLVMSIFKGIIGRDKVFFEEQLRAQALGGVNLIKDDEILYDVPELPFEERIQIANRVLDEVEQETGRKVIYAVNLSGPVFDLPEKARRGVELGARAFLFNVHSYGLDVLKGLRALELGVPLMAHPAFSGAIAGSPDYGLSYPLILAKLTRLAGADLVLFPAPFGSVTLSEETAGAIVAECVKTLPISAAFPVPSAGIHPGLVNKLIDSYGVDQVINAGGGVHGHPEGAAAGGLAFTEAIDLYYGGTTGSAYEQAVTLWGS
ncbi:2,3-diketo-5-methylthiopentyl-1-phosphate enolase [Macrococcus equipercicus]|uniref:2,3-diketo-5-methylthiopentyl-1-phosphate enolase n=1 Tax=Macrococcus equipercicus TaxID=69967 RepID=A0A9Q9F1N5_9STAP|nr:2,3-diketo-5-methylthiopentyl-1-phosphate enolase [Macrococcus equipercicus]UTH14142.1 2,3-diketo-5-methylthiopentyl-1-phosphate enolase [Macrococcus equipercicus]